MDSEFDLDSRGLTAEDYGGGTELPVTNYLVFGLLTFWIYNVWHFHFALSRHFRRRLNSFGNLIKHVNTSKEDEETLNILMEKGFSSKMNVKYTCVTLYAMSMALMFGNLIVKRLYTLGDFGEDIFYGFTYEILGLAAFTFYASTILFLLWVSRKLKDHEYFELLYAKYVTDHSRIKMIKPSVNFRKRWVKNQNMIALFLILSLPMIFSPVIAARTFNAAIDGGADSSSIRTTLAVGYVLIFACAGIFHFCGTKILTDMFNDHLKTETENRKTLFKDHYYGQSTEMAADNLLSDDLPTEIIAPERALAAVMMTDMVGFSKSMAEDEEKTYFKLVEHKKIMRQEIKKQRGEEIDTAGDAFFIRFASAVDAVTAALNVQKRFLKYNKGKEESDQIWIRIGIHLGDILFMDNDVFGDGVNIAARIEPMAEPGGVCISGVVYNVVRKSIDIKAVSLGRKEMKNIADVPEIFRILIEDKS